MSYCIKFKHLINSSAECLCKDMWFCDQPLPQSYHSYCKVFILFATISRILPKNQLFSESRLSSKRVPTHSHDDEPVGKLVKGQ